MVSALDVDNMAGFSVGWRAGDAGFRLGGPGRPELGGAPLPLSRTGIYSITFLAFWLLMMAATALTMLLSLPSIEVNHGTEPESGSPRSNASSEKPPRV